MFTPEENKILDGILEERRTTRTFTEDAPSRELVGAVVNAGLLAPYASISSQDVDIFRHFFVLMKGNPIIARIDGLIRKQSLVNLEQYRAARENDPILQQFGAGYEKRMAAAGEKGLPTFKNVPCLIVAAEWRGARRAEKQSLAHAMQNMWLKATALNLGFVLVSPIEGMTHSQEFCDLFGYRAGEYGFHACIVGYPKQAKRVTKPLRGAVTWL